MTEQLGNFLTRLECGDSVVVAADGEQYEGDVTDAQRWECELVGGFMESGDVRIDIELTAQSVNAQNLPGNHLLITATEKVPTHWDTRHASIFDLQENETIRHLGEVTEIEVVNNPE